MNEIRICCTCTSRTIYKISATNTNSMSVFVLTYISAAVASLSPGVPAPSSPSLSPFGQRGRMNRPRSHWKCQMQHEDGRSSAGWPQPERESL